MYVSVILPVFNEAHTLRELYTRLCNGLEGHERQLIIVDDGSTDRTIEILREISTSDGSVHVVRFSRNFGQHAAIRAAMERVAGDVAIFMDTDLQDRPEEIPKLLAALNDEHVDIVCARSEIPSRSWFRTMTSKLFLSLAAFFVGRSVRDTAMMFRAVKRHVIDSINRSEERPYHTMLLMGWMGFRTVHVNVFRDNRKSGVSRYSPLKLFGHALDGLLTFETRLLRYVIASGLLVSAVAFSFGLFLTFRWMFLDRPPAGWTSLSVLISCFSGVILSVVGVIGEYMGRVLEEVRGRPAYVVAFERPLKDAVTSNRRTA